MQVMSEALRKFTTMATIYSKLFVLAILAVLLLVLPAAGMHPPINSVGILAHEWYEYVTSVVPLYDVSLNKEIYLLILLAIGVFAIVIKADRGSHAVLPRAKLIASIELILISAPVLIYIFITFNRLLTQRIAYIFISIGLAASFTVLQANKRARSVAETFTIQVVFALISALIISHFLMRLGLVPVLEPATFIFNIDLHLSVLIGPAARLIDGYPWLSGAEPSYGLLMPALTSWLFRQSSFSIENCMAYLQYLQAALVALVAIAMFLRSKNFICVALVLPVLYFFEPASLLIFIPNHNAWRYMGVAFVFFALSLGCLKRRRLHPALKGAVGAIAVLLNFETGLVIVAALTGSEVLAQRGQLQRALIAAGSALVLILVSVFLITGQIPSEYFYHLYRNWALNYSVGGEPYNAIPVFAVIVLHCAIIVWRTARSKIRTPHQDFDFVASIYCLGWSMYFVNRPNDTYLATIFIVYSFVFMRLLGDARWIVNGKTQMLSYGFVFLCAFSYFSSFVSYLDTFYVRMQARSLEVGRTREMEALSTVTSSALELSQAVGAADGYITPFPFFVRGISGLPNNLTTQDPFFGLRKEKELTSFLSGNLPKVLFLPRIETLFSPKDPPVAYRHFIDRILLSLKARGYTVQRELQYWTVFEYVGD
jgi:hypothetical protein